VTSPRPLWHEAAAFSARVHRHQIRKDGRTPYAAHPARVALELAATFGVRDEEVLAAALLHDVIEDCTVDYDTLFQRFGPRVAQLVVVMTKDSRLPEAEREEAYRAQLARGPLDGRLIKLADLCDNLRDAATAEVFAKAAAKAEAMLPMMRDPPLETGVKRVRALLEAGFVAEAPARGSTHP